LRTSDKQPEASSAAQRFLDAFERLKLGVPQVLPKGTPVSQNNVAKEAGCDPSALRKRRFPLLVLDIQEWVEAHKGEQPLSARQRLLKQRGKSRDLRETIADLKKQRDAADGKLADADLRIVELTERLADAQALARVLHGRDYWRSVADLRLLRSYERERKAAMLPLGLATDSLQQLFARTEGPWQALRNWGMKGFERSGPLKEWMVRQAMGTH